jgi:hypothetical protein
MRTLELDWPRAILLTLATGLLGGLIGLALDATLGRPVPEAAVGAFVGALASGVAYRFARKPLPQSSE